MKHRIVSQIVAYGLALLLVAAALGLRWALQGLLGDHTPLELFALASIAAALIGGLGPGLLAMICGELAGDYFFVRPYHTFGPGSTIELAYASLFLLVTGACILFIEALQRARVRAEKNRRLAEQRAEQLRRSVQEMTEAEATIRELAAAVESAQDAIITAGLDGQVKSWNAAAETMFGFTAAEMIGRSISQITPAERLPELSGVLQELASGKIIQPFETLRLSKSGKPLYVSVSFSAVRDEAGQITGASVIFRDITIHKEAEQEIERLNRDLTDRITDLRRANSSLQESEQRFQAMGDTAPLLIWMADANQRCTWVNQTWLNFTGRTLEEERGEGWFAAIHPEDLPRSQESFKIAFARQEPFDMEYRLRRTDGEYRWLLDRGVPHFDPEGKFLGYIGSCIDVTERKQTEEALENKYEELRRAQEQLRERNQQLEASRHALEIERSRYRELFNSAPTGYIVTSRQGVIQQVNTAAAAMLNESPDFLQGFPFARLLARSDRAPFFANIGRLTRREIARIENWEAQVQPHNRPPFPCSLTVNLVQDDPSQLTGLRWIIRDITDRKIAETRVLRLNAELEQRVRERTAALEAANHELEAFSYSVSHDLRAPLRSINGFSQAVLEQYGNRLDEQGRKYLQYAHDASIRMSCLIEDLLELSRVNRGDLRRTEVDLTALATLVGAELQKSEPDRKVQLAIQPNLVVHGDEGLLRIALENLLGNAWKFTSRNPNALVEFGAKNQEARRVFFVRDNGAGFNMANASRLFGVFQRLHSQQDFPGTGVGLATVKRILTRHGGEIWAESKTAEGASFYFTLPQFQNGSSSAPASGRQLDAEPAAVAVGSRHNLIPVNPALTG